MVGSGEAGKEVRREREREKKNKEENGEGRRKKRREARWMRTKMRTMLVLWRSLSSEGLVSARVPIGLLAVGCPGEYRGRS